MHKIVCTTVQEIEIERAEIVIQPAKFKENDFGYIGYIDLNNGGVIIQFPSPGCIR